MDIDGGTLSDILAVKMDRPEGSSRRAAENHRGARASEKNRPLMTSL